MNRTEVSANGDRHLRTLLTLGPVGQRTDADLLARFVAGSGDGDDAAELAFAALVERHGPTVLRVARTILGDEATSLDAFQATFLILAQKARSLRVGDSLTPWLATVARRVALGARKARARRHRLEQAAARPEALTEPPSHLWGETLRAVLNEVDRLPEPYRAAVIACHLDGLTHREAADRLDWPLGTLQSRLDRGRRKLRDRLTRQGLAPSALALLPPSGLSMSLPSGLAASLAQIATGWAIRLTTPPLIAPGVLVILQPTSKGLVMANLKLSGLILGAALAAGGSGWAIGVGSSPVTNASPVPTQAVASGTTPRPADPITRVVDVDIHGFKYPGPSDLIAAAGRTTLRPTEAAEQYPTNQAPPPITEPTPVDDAIRRPPTAAIPEFIPPPAEGPGHVYLLCFTDLSWERSQLVRPDLADLARRGYPVQHRKIEEARVEAEQWLVETTPTFLMVQVAGGEGLQRVLARTSEPTTSRQLADWYNQHRPKPDPIPNPEEFLPAARNPDTPAILCFVDEQNLPPGTGSEWQPLIQRGYPIRVLNFGEAAEMKQQFEVVRCPTYVVTDAEGIELARADGPRTTKEIAELYNGTMNAKQAGLLKGSDDLAPPGDGPDLPTLLCFIKSNVRPDSTKTPRLDRLAARGYPVRPVDMTKTRDLNDRYKIEASPTFVLINGSGVELARTTGAMPTKQLAEFYNQHRPQAIAQAPQESREPSFTPPVQPPRPWETVVRIKTHLSIKEWAFSSGTIIASMPGESIILASAHSFRDRDGKFLAPDQINHPISIDLFASQLPSSGRPQLTCMERDLPAEVVAIHTAQDFALVRIRPGRVLSVAPIAPTWWTATKGIPLISVGCSHGNDATAWDTQILDPKVPMSSGTARFSMIRCTNQPVEGRSGGGLFTHDGYLVGLCEFADPNEHVGLYLETRVLQDVDKHIERVSNVSELNLASLKKAMPGIILGSNKPLAPNRPDSDLAIGSHVVPAASQDQRLNELERKLDRVLQSLDNIRGELKADLPERPSKAPR